MATEYGSLFDLFAVDDAGVDSKGNIGDGRILLHFYAFMLIFWSQSRKDMESSVSFIC